MKPDDIPTVAPPAAKTTGPEQQERDAIETATAARKDASPVVDEVADEPGEPGVVGDVGTTGCPAGEPGEPGPAGDVDGVGPHDTKPKGRASKKR